MAVHPAPTPASMVVHRAEAMAQRTHHQFVPGIGYIKHPGPPAALAGPAGSKNCAPPKGTKDGSVHMLKPGNGHPPIRMIWIASEMAWAPTKLGKGNRLAWTHGYLSRAGWEYVEPAAA